MSTDPTSLNAPFSGTAAYPFWVQEFKSGPAWNSFEKLRTAGPAALDTIVSGTVGTLRSKNTTYRILVDSDFQKLIALASEVHRLRQGMMFVVQASKVVAKHPDDQDSVDLLLQSAAMLSQANLLPIRDGHGEFVISPGESAAYSDPDTEVEPGDIPRPAL